jgi:uncharacterized membrane protein YbhN (UPF0104 family)
MGLDTGLAVKKKDSRKSRVFQLALKLGITALCFWYISKKVDFSQALQALRNANWLLLFLSTFLYALSKIIGAIRLNIYFKNINLNFYELKHLKLYWLGLFYNLFLPGSISGDAYKVVILNKRISAPYKKTSTAVLLDRFSGLLGLGIILSVYGLLVLDGPLFSALFLCGPPIAVGIFYFVIRRFFKEFLPGFVPTLLLGIAVQAIQVAGVYLILKALSLELHYQQWLFIFLAGQVLSVLPLSLGGGLGTREVVFTEGAGFFHLDPRIGIIISLLFYLTSVMNSVWGAYYIFHDPLKGLLISDEGYRQEGDLFKPMHLK